jgi:hypothetical protein
MTGALAYKELRENSWIAAVGLAALLLVAVAAMGFSPLPGLIGRPQHLGQIPFLSDSFTYQFALVACVLAVALGFRQSLGDLAGDAQLFVLHRPASRRRIFGTKLAVGLGLYLVCGALPIALYALWAATPGTHASPFAWSMTGGTWTAWLAMTAVYLGALLSGIRPAGWLGTRLAPLAAGFLVAGMCALPLPWSGGLLVLIVGDALLALAILQVALTRDFA